MCSYVLVGTGIFKFYFSIFPEILYQLLTEKD